MQCRSGQTVNAGHDQLVAVANIIEALLELWASISGAAALFLEELVAVAQLFPLHIQRLSN